jgi:tetratricopeptide (TPR) repeat protein
VALKGRGVERFNLSVGSRSLTAAAKADALRLAKDDLKAAAGTASESVNLLKNAAVPSEAAEARRYNGNRYAAALTYAEAMRLYASKGDPSQADAARSATNEYLAIEPDPAKKAKAQLGMAQMLLDAGQASPALAEFQAVLEDDPDSVEANLGAGLALYSLGDKSKYDDAKGYLRHFVEVAPDSNPFKADAKAILQELGPEKPL